eukprot:2554468-Prorocentrum_lima.AAC.1
MCIRDRPRSLHWCGLLRGCNFLAPAAPSGAQLPGDAQTIAAGLAMAAQPAASSDAAAGYANGLLG